jgi:hypothetical protein
LCAGAEGLGGGSASKGGKDGEGLHLDGGGW